MLTISDLMRFPGNRGFYQELQLVLSIYRLEETELRAGASYIPEGVADSGDPARNLIKHHGVFLLYRLLLAINENTISQFLTEVRRVDSQLSALCQLCARPQDMVGGKQFWRQVNTVVFSLVPSFSFWNFKTQCEETLYRDEAVEALQIALRSSPYDPICNVASFIRSGGHDSVETQAIGNIFDEFFGTNRQTNYFDARYGSKLALPMEQVERLGVMNYTLPPDPLKAKDRAAPYPR